MSPPPQNVQQRTFTAAVRYLQNDTQLLPRYLRKSYFLSHDPLASSKLGIKCLSWSRTGSPTQQACAFFSSKAPTTHTTSHNEAISTPQSITETVEELPHRRRQRLRAQGGANASEQELRPDASSQLSTLSSSLPKSSLKGKLAAFLALTKPRLSFLIVLTATTAYGLYPVPSILHLDPSVTPLPTLSTSTLTFCYLTVGTFLSSACANTINMLLEPKYDALMTRTRNRPLVRKLMSTRAAVLFAVGTAAAGLSALYFGTNSTVAGLSAANIVLYGFIYTPLKRISVINTWVGAVVGGIPPLMGWAAAAGQTAITGHDTWRDLLFGPDSAGGWLLAGLLFAWQFPHFNALSHLIRDEYKNAGYKMLAWTNPARNGRVALRYSLLMFPLCAGLWWAGVVDKGFLVGGVLINSWLTKEAYRFWKFEGAKGTARGLFWASVWHLPLLMVGTLAAKKGIWDGVWSRAMGYSEDDEDLDSEEAEETASVRPSLPTSQAQTS
ncbi:protoheme IX farnesyltransferase [Nannizzia gypsea CBS 118893]|uniref:Protoheme IX farnesyltransferase, mitochondrial n=1 Tax=Arthroderma gypseum (strain ATCC MYA-4604 / CBS 118893) TaxID=535722 RepID=E4V5M1_ARTGP|nr:protoheme IX farnesyltransferase [Nannizzia gypsea CBS 118893]EFR05396.1 protoheme IX farnesyltransferase [Nannizzia gypsea CBS 118893]